LPRDPLSALEAGLRGAPRPADLVKVRTVDGAQRLYLGGGGVGLDAESAEYASTLYRNWPGRSRYIASALHAFFKHPPNRIRIVVPEQLEKEIPWRDFVLASVLNTPTFGAGVRLAPRARIDDGSLDFAFLEKLTLLRLFRILPLLVFRGTLSIPHLLTMQVRKIRLETEIPSFFHGDGEILGPTPAEIEVVPNAIRFLAPRLSRH